MPMSTDALNYHGRPKLCGATMVMGLSGWMDGGEVSTGTIDCLVTRVGGKAFAEIDPEGFYIYNFQKCIRIFRNKFCLSKTLNQSMSQ